MNTRPDPLRVTILTALPVETDAVLGQLDSIQSFMVGDTVESRGVLRDCVAPCEVTVIELGPGNIETAMEAGRIKSEGLAQVLLFVGIAGALKDLELGDVVAANEVVWLHRAKMENGKRRTRPQVQPCTRELVQVAQYTARQQSWKARLTELPTNDPSAKVGQILSGEELIKDEGYREQLLKEYSDAKAVENEGYGLVRAGSSAMKVIVIRGASDDADKSKHDKSQPTAARAAAAFAAQLINDFLSLLDTRNNSTTELAGTPKDRDIAEASVASTAHVRAATAIDTLRDDTDLLEDDVAEIHRFAAAEFAAADSELRIAMIESLAAEIDDRSDTLTDRRLREYARAFVAEHKRAAGRVEWDLLLKRHPVGAAVMAAQFDIAEGLNAVERRRLLSALIGNAETPREGTSIAWSYFLNLMQTGCLTAAEENRLLTAMQRVPYEILGEAGFSAQYLMPKLVTDLEDPDYHAQNRAARYISSSNLLSDDSDLPFDEQGRLASLLIKAARLGSFGARDLTTRSRMANWPVATLSVALWSTVTNGRDRIDSPSGSLRDVLAAAILGGKLHEVLEATLRAVDAAGLAAVSEETVREERPWLAGQASKLPEEAQVAWDHFVGALYDLVPRKADH